MQITKSVIVPSNIWPPWCARTVPAPRERPPGTAPGGRNGTVPNTHSQPRGSWVRTSAGGPLSRRLLPRIPGAPRPLRPCTRGSPRRAARPWPIPVVGDRTNGAGYAFERRADVRARNGVCRTTRPVAMSLRASRLVCDGTQRDDVSACEHLRGASRHNVGVASTCRRGQSRSTGDQCGDQCTPAPPSTAKWGRAARRGTRRVTFHARGHALSCHLVTATVRGNLCAQDTGSMLTQRVQGRRPDVTPEPVCRGAYRGQATHRRALHRRLYRLGRAVASSTMARRREPLVVELPQPPAAQGHSSRAYRAHWVHPITH